VEISKVFVLEHIFHCAETWTLWKEDQKHLESFEMWCWRRMENISWADCVRNEDILRTVKEKRNILHKIKRRKANWIGHILRRNCLLKHAIEGKIEDRTEGSGRLGRVQMERLDDLKEMREYCKLKEEALGHTLKNSLWKRLWACHKTDYGMMNWSASTTVQ
jgi:hypothetical protein